MDIQVEGHNNRVAGRDYVELNAELRLTPDQLQALAVRPCSCCEVRLVSGRVQLCNHCLQKRAAKAQREKYASFTLLVFFVWGLLLQNQPDHGADIVPGRFFELGFTAGALVFLGTVVFLCLREWWLFNGEALKAALWQGLVQLVRGEWK